MEPSPLEVRLAALEARLSRLENHLGLSAPISAQTVEPLPEPIVSQPQPEAKTGNWLGIIAIVCFVLAGGLIVKLSIQSGWLTPMRQISLAALFGMGLIAAGFALLKTDRAYASLLPGGGIIVLYATVFAAHRYHLLIPYETALVTMAIVSAVNIWIYTHIKRDAYAVTAAVGAYIAPLILGLHAGGTFSLYYFLVCSATFAIISIRLQSRILILVASYLAIIMNGLIGIELTQQALAAKLLAANFFVFAVGTYFYAIRNRQALSVGEAWYFLPVLLLFYALEYHFIERMQPGLAPWISLGFAAILMGFYLSARKYFPENPGSQSLILAFVSIVCFHSLYLELLPDDIRPWLFSVIMLAILFLSGRWFSKTKGGSFYIPTLVVLAILIKEYCTMVLELLSTYGHKWLPVSFVAFLSLWTAIARRAELLSKYEGIVLAGAHLLAVTGLYRLTYGIGSLAVSASWLFYGVGVIVFAFMRKDTTMAKSALFVLAFAAAKALLYDAASATALVRIFCLLLTGAVLYGCGLFLRRIGHWRES